ncbi:MAG: NapC/NirT family cytochrome c [Kiritimatiellae bacterium]|nr:NapC/NirT family cytochrome c [Kiritimatiellia bacterium]
MEHKPKREAVEHVPAGPVGRRVLVWLDKLRRWWWLFIIGAILFQAVLIAGAEYATSRPSFCGSCHIMDTYHETWEKSEHAEEGVTCVDCHYAPGEHHTLKAKFKGLGQLFSYLGTTATTVQKAALVNDASCTAAGCHSTDEGTEEGQWMTNRIAFASYTRTDGSEATVPFVHETHFAKENWMEGQEKHCSLCHRRETADHHMEVAQKVCHLCHFKNEALNEKLSKCSLCHTIPVTPFRDDASDSDELITHQILEERGVACASCHLHEVRGNGVMREQRCLECHENDQAIMQDASNAELMHEKHVAAQAANCFSCHEIIQHGRPPEGFDHFDAALSDCKACHATPHQNKRLLISGTGGKGVDKPLPIKHHDMGMGCLACHIVDAVDDKGRGKKLATASVCINCHSEKEGALVAKWKSDVSEFLEEAFEYEQEALDALVQARGKLPQETITAAELLIQDGQTNLGIVNAGGGVHNKKYSALLLDISIEYFEDAIAELETE